MSDKYLFEEIKHQIKELLEEAISLVPDSEEARARSYWYAQIATALDDDHEYMGSSMHSMQDTLEDWNEEEAEEDWDDNAGRPAQMRDEDWN
tara:strand:+ start:450 stop:725 length:276 start_codon:yes stop_codon:yes gene_type:complete